MTVSLMSLLKKGPVVVHFVKEDGSERVMECTLQPELLPPMPVKEDVETAKPKKENLDVVSVYDIKAQGWRSFILKNIKNIKIEI